MQHPRQFIQHGGQVRPEVQGVYRQRSIDAGIRQGQGMGIALAQYGTPGQAAGGKMPVAGVDHGTGQLDTHVATATGLQQQRRKGGVAWADFQHLLSGSDGQQCDRRLVEGAVAAVHRFAHGQRGLAMGLPQLRGQGACIQHQHRPSVRSRTWRRRVRRRP
ncbi:hypothetical protein D3C72_1692530 [compost metagenome]